MSRLESENNITANALLRNSVEDNAFEAIYNYKAVLRCAAAATREILLADEHLPASKDCILTSCSRALFNNNLSLASHLIHRYRTAREHIFIKDAKVHMHSAENMSLQISSARHDALSHQISVNESVAARLPPNSSKFAACKNRIKTFSRLMRQWVPIRKFLTISAIANNLGEIVTDEPPQIITALAKHWAPFLDGSKNNYHADVACGILDSLVDKGNWNWSQVRLPNCFNFSKVVAKTPDSSPGYDGLPYSAHHSHSEISSVLLEKCFRQMRHFDPNNPYPLFEFNNILQICIPKKDYAEHHLGVSCQVEDTRSLSCKNSDNKIICRAVSSALMPVVAAAAAAAAADPQGGFISGRHFTNNVILIDTVCRVYSNLVQKYGSAIAAFFDFSNAFPSVFLQWIFLVLRWLNLPTGLYNFFVALYHNVLCFIAHSGQRDFMCLVQNGVLQGCPFAALLFVLSMEPFVCLLKNKSLTEN